MSSLHLPVSILQWTLIALLSLWTLALLGIAYALFTDSYGGMGPVPVILALLNGVAAIPFLANTGPTLLVLARIIAIAQGAAVILTCFLFDGMANTLVSMGNSKNAAVSPVAMVGYAVGIALAVLALATPPCSPPGLGDLR